MGKPGGFFKKLNAKQKRQASKQRRGTKGASKEVRRQKQNERVEYYAAQREAEQLAQISSSSDDEASTDSEAEEDRRDKKLHRLQRMLGVKTKVRRQEHGREKEDEDEEAQSQDDEVADDASVASSEVPDDESDHPSHDSNDAPEEETDEEDGNEFDGFLMDDEEDDEAVGEASDNPLFDLLDDDNEEGFNDTYRVDESGALVEDDSESGDDEDDEGEEEGEEDEEDDEEEVEGAYEEEEDHTDDAARRSESKVLLPQFKMSSIQLDRLDLKEGGGILERDDPWMQKFHLNTIRAFRSSSTATDALQSVPLSQDAISALTHSNDEQIRRRKELETSVEKKQLGVLFIGSAELAAAHPENLSIRATERAVEAQLHSPFCPTATGSNGSSSATKSAHLHTTSSMEKPPYLHSALWDMWCVYRERMWKEHLPSAEGFAPLTAEERGQLDLLMAYPDLLDSTRCWANAESRCEIYVLHLLNHWFKARSIVVAHDTILAARKRQRRASSKKSHKGKGGKAKRQREEEDEPVEEENDDDGDDHDLELRDRGFSKTRLLVLLPMRNIAYRYVYTMVQILGADPSACPKLNTFEQDFSEVEEAMDPTFKRRPKDYQRQFDGNIDDAFCVGIRLEPSRVHVYSHPLNSDIILCSPLGLRRRLEKNGDIAVSLSSVEVCVVDEAHVLLEQNWQHVTEVMNLVNQRPKDTTHGLSDLRRVYAWALDGKSAEHRQTIVATNISHATILSSFRNWSQNTSGKMLLQHAEEVGSLSRVLVPIRQHFVRFNPPSLDAVDDERLTYFMEQIYATKINPLAERDVRIIILVPSYLDFVRLRNALHRDYRDSFVAISEYTSIKQQRRALGQFSDLEMPVLLLTERCFFFRRYFVKLAEVLVCYSPPLFPDFYCTLINKLVANSPNAMALTLFSRFDTHELNRLVGTARMKLMLERETSAFSFVTS